MKKHSLTIRMPGVPKRSYPIVIHDDTFLSLIPFLKKGFCDYTLAIITDTTVQKLYGKSLKKKLQTEFSRVYLFCFSSGEKYKNEQIKQSLDHALLQKKCGRNTLIVALGGGVVGDMAGFVASTYLRGVPYIQIPTTLLAMVDSSIGGKTGIDTVYGKNTIGAFWQPSAVIINTSYLKSLPKDHWRSGLMEAVKISLILRPNMQASLIEVMKKKSETALRKVILAALEEKARVVEHDEKEQGERMVLNFGHTIGHAIEKVSGYSVLHGIAVGLGMLVEARISHELGILSDSALSRIEILLNGAGVDMRTLKKWKARDIIAATQYDKKKSGGRSLYVLLKDIGSVYYKENQWAHPVREDIVKSVLKNLKQGGAR